MSWRGRGGKAWLAAAMLGVALSDTPRAEPRRGADPPPPPAGRPASIQDALLRPLALPFAEPTPLSEVVAHLQKALGAPVVLDRAGLDRVDVRPDDTVELALEGARLKTGLKLLLDQLDLTYRVEPEDNLLIITDVAGATDPLAGVLAELKELHRDVHDLQDALSEVQSLLGVVEEGPLMRKPTIIEEVPAPEAPSGAPTTSPAPRTRPGA